MKKRNGFTLVELLAVIAILAILLLVIVPKVNDVLKDSKDSVNESSTLSLAKTADLYYSKNAFDDSVNASFDGDTDVLDQLKISGKKPESGFVLIDQDGNVSVGAVFTGKCYVKGFTDVEATKTDNMDACVHTPLPE